MNKILSLILALILINPYAWADSSISSEVLPDLNNTAANTSVINDALRKTTQSLLALENNIGDINDKTTGLLAVNRGGTGQDASNWPAGDVVYMSSLGVMGHEAATGGTIVFTLSGTWTAPAGITTIYVYMMGGGGGGGGRTGANGSGGGGGASGSFTLFPIPYSVTPGNSYTVTIGAGGTGGGTSTTGQTGGTTTFDMISVPGGGGGVSANDSIGHAGGTSNSTTTLTLYSGVNGGANTGGDSGAELVYYAGFGNGGSGTTNAGTGGVTYFGGGGGGNPFGAGGHGGGNAAGGDGTGYGSGGGGGSQANPANGGNGAPGFIIIKY